MKRLTRKYACIQGVNELYAWRHELPGRFIGAALTFISRITNYLRLRRLSGHRDNVRRSRGVLTTVRSFCGPHAQARSFCYLRQVEPLVFEEVVMSALEDAGFLGVRNRRYSGDAGVDGIAWNPALGWYAVQVKRYRAHINRQHVADFADTIRRRNFAGGLFVHTGRSGVGVYDFLRGNGIILVSGNRLVDLIVHRDVSGRRTE